MKKIKLPGLNGSERQNAEVLVEVRFPELADLETGHYVFETRHALRGWDRMVPDERDITSVAYAVPPGMPYVVMVTISMMNGRDKTIYERHGTVPTWSGSDPERAYADPRSAKSRRRLGPEQHHRS